MLFTFNSHRYSEVVDEEEDAKQLVRLRAEQKAKKMKTFNVAAARAGGGNIRNDMGWAAVRARNAEKSTFDAFKVRGLCTNFL